MIERRTNPRFSLAGKLSVAVIATIAVFFVLITSSISIFLYSKSNLLWKEQTSGITSFFADINAHSLETREYSELTHNISRLMLDRNILYIEIKDSAGNIAGSSYSLNGADKPSGTALTRHIISHSGKDLGTAEIIFSRSNLYAGVGHIVAINFLIMLLFTAAIVIIIKRRISSIISEPLRAFLESARKMTRGESPQPIEIPAEDEIGLLAHEFNLMIADLKKSQTQHIQAQKMETIGTIAGGIAHDFNNILGGIIGNISLLRYKLKAGTAQGHEIDGYLHSVETISNRAASLAKQLLTLSQRQEILLETVDLCSIIGNVTEICEKTFGRSIEICEKKCSESALTSGDPTQIEQAILNVCINAVHAMTIMRDENENQGGQLCIELHGPSIPPCEKYNVPCDIEIPYWGITISDEGVGMGDEEMTRVFDPFFTRKNEGQGIGLGMTMVYTIVSRHAGFVTIDSQQGKGTTVTLHFPLYNQEENRFQRDEQTAFTPMNKDMLILIADDEDYILNLAASILAFGGYQSITAKNGDEAVKLYIERQNDIKLVILDLLMPYKNGIDAYKEIRLVNPDAKIMFTSGLRNRLEESFAAIPDDSAFLAKPYTAEQLLRIVDRIVMQKTRSAG